MLLVSPLIRCLRINRIIHRAFLGSVSLQGKLSLTYTCKVCGTRQVSVRKIFILFTYSFPISIECSA